MARGWESKAVEAQMEEAGERWPSVRSPRESADPGVSRARGSLLLARARIVNELQSTRKERYRALLETSLAAVDRRLSGMG